MPSPFALAEPRFSTANLADACLKLGIPFAVSGQVRPLLPGSRIEGPARPVKHFGSVDVFLEAIAEAAPGDVLVVDNQGRMDEGCLGDLTVLEAAAAGLAGIVLWGCHRDTAELRRIGLPLFSRGHCPTGPRRLDERSADLFDRAVFDGSTISSSDVVVADEDGILAVHNNAFVEAVSEATAIRERESRQAGGIGRGASLRQQFDLDGYVRARETDSKLTFREHLARSGGQIEV